MGVFYYGFDFLFRVFFFLFRVSFFYYGLNLFVTGLIIYYGIPSLIFVTRFIPFHASRTCVSPAAMDDWGQDEEVGGGDPNSGGGGGGFHEWDSSEDAQRVVQAPPAKRPRKLAKPRNITKVVAAPELNSNKGGDVFRQAGHIHSVASSEGVLVVNNATLEARRYYRPDLHDDSAAVFVSKQLTPPPPRRNQGCRRGLQRAAQIQGKDWRGEAEHQCGSQGPRPLREAED